MNKKYFAWKDGKQNTNSAQEWDVITSKDFLEICKSNIGKSISERRFFARIPGLEDGDIYYVMECDYPNYLKSVAEAMERMRKRIEEKKLIDEGLFFDIVSLDYAMIDENGEEYSLHDIVADPNSLFEDKLATSLDLAYALSKLSQDERELIEVFFLSEKTKTEREYAEETGIPQKTINNRKLKILRKMKSFLAQN